MAHQPIQATKKPITIDTIQWDGTPESATAVVDWVLGEGGTATYACVGNECTETAEGHVIAIETLEGTMHAGKDWWIIKGVDNEYYPCRDDIFRKTYDIL